MSSDFASTFAEDILSKLKAKERLSGMRMALSSMPQDFLSSRHSLYSKAREAPPPNCEAGVWEAWVANLPKDKHLRRVYLSLMGNIALCFDPDIDFPWQEYPASLKKFSDSLPELWLALKSPLPVLESLSSDLLPDGSLFSGLGQEEGLAQNLGVAVNLDAEEAENGRLRLALLARKRQRDESKISESRAIEERRVRLLVERQQLISEMEALDAADDATAPETEVVALRKQVTSLSALLASSGSSGGAHTALAGAGAGAVHPWVKHVQYSGLHAVSASTSTALSAHLKDNPGGHNRGELVPELDKVKSWPAGFSREVHAVTQRPFPPQVIKDFVGGR